ncbi:MAG: hypothetical protein K0R39_5182 [Symbiobacteriaceae bacterium]|jgi:hypothetical protein|nr:hypothetical protein [Symbiobacteriaceae bacterium]
MAIGSVQEAWRALPDANKAVADAVKLCRQECCANQSGVGSCPSSGPRSCRKQAVKTVAKAALSGTGLGTLAVAVASLVKYNLEYNRA